MLAVLMGRIAANLFGSEGGARTHDILINSQAQLPAVLPQNIYGFNGKDNRKPIIECALSLFGSLTSEPAVCRRHIELRLLPRSGFLECLRLTQHLYYSTFRLCCQAFF